MNELAKTAPRNIIATFDDAERAARAMAGSGFFQDARQANQAIVKILAGQELGFGPFASMTGVAIIQGKPAIGANLQAAAVKRTGKYNYRVIEMTNEACELEFYEGGQVVGKSRFDMKDAAAAGLSSKDNWKKFPRNMLFARAISNGIKWYAPDIFNGATVYTPDELGATEDEEGRAISQPAPAEFIEGHAEEVAAQKPAAKQAAPAEMPAITPAELTLEQAKGLTNSKGDFYGDIDTETLTHIFNNAKTPPLKKRAAELILASRNK
jgi:hypothetical protein